jgi:hypothetical protein
LVKYYRATYSGFCSNKVHRIFGEQSRFVRSVFDSTSSARSNKYSIRIRRSPADAAVPAPATAAAAAPADAAAEASEAEEEVAELTTRPLSVAELEEEDGSGGEEVEDALPEDGTELDPEMYGNNTPVVKVGRRRQSLNPTGVWVHVKRIKCDRMRKSLNSQGKKPTHVCVICWQQLTLTFDKSTGRHLTTNGLNHMRDVHAEEEVAKQSQGRKDDKSISTLAGMLAAGGTSASSMENFVVTAAQMALSSTARFCV